MESDGVGEGAPPRGLRRCVLVWRVFRSGLCHFGKIVGLELV